MSARVLIVENDAMSRELARRVLAAGGYEVTCAGDAEEALRLAPRLRPHLVLMDVGLPGIDGLEATRRLRALKATARAKIAVLSAHAGVGDGREARAAGCDDYLVKPVGARELLERVALLIGTPASSARSGRPT